MYNRFLKVKDSNDLVRDLKSGAILKTNQAAIQKLVLKRENQHLLESKVETLENTVKNLENKLDAILNILTKESKC